MRRSYHQCIAAISRELSASVLFVAAIAPAGRSEREPRPNEGPDLTSGPDGARAVHALQVEFARQKVHEILHGDDRQQMAVIGYQQPP